MRTVADPVANHWLRAIVSLIAISARSISLFCRPAAPSDDGPCGRLLGDDPDLSCARHRRSRHIVHRSKANRDLPQTRRLALLQDWPLCIEGGGPLVVATHIFHQAKQRRSARRVHVALHAGLSKAAAWDAGGSGLIHRMQ